MQGAPSFDSNSEITTAHVQAATESRAAFRAFLDRVAAVSAPADGAPKILLACGALATCDWLDGELRIEIDGDDAVTNFALLIDAGHRERLFPVTPLNVPFDEFVRAVRLAPQLMAPLSVREHHDSRIVLTHRSASRRPSSHPTTRLAAVRDDVYSKPTVVRMTAVRPEALPPKDGDEN